MGVVKFITKFLYQKIWGGSKCTYLPTWGVHKEIYLATIPAKPNRLYIQQGKVCCYFFLHCGRRGDSRPPLDRIFGRREDPHTQFRNRAFEGGDDDANLPGARRRKFSGPCRHRKRICDCDGRRERRPLVSGCPRPRFGYPFQIAYRNSAQSIDRFFRRLGEARSAA